MMHVYRQVKIKNGQPIIIKAVGNTGSGLEIGDVFIGIVNGVFVIGIYNGGDLEDILSYTVVNQQETGLLNGLLSYWKFNELTNVNEYSDSKGNKTAISVSADCVVKTGAIGKCAYTPTDGDRIEIPENGDYFGSGGVDKAVSFSIRNNVQVFNTTYGLWLLHKMSGVAGVDRDMAFYFGTDKHLNIEFYSATADKFIKCRTNDPVSLNGVWRTLGFSYDGSGQSVGLRLWLNGVELICSRTQSNTYVGQQNIVPIAKIGIRGIDTRARSGWMDNAFIGGRVWTPSEWLEQHNKNVALEELI